MSLFETVKLGCPVCGTETDFQTVHSVNADRRSDLRDAILEGTFQQETCKSCGKLYRLDPQFTYLDVGRHQWVAVYPFDDLERWHAMEDDVRETYELAFGSKAPTLAKELGREIKPRLVFGWPARGAKLAVDEHGLDDVQLELLKVGLLRNMEESPLDEDTELRFLEVPADGPEELALAWLDSTTAEFIQGLRVPRDLYDDVAAEPEAWKALRSELEGRLFVDMQRLITVGT